MARINDRFADGFLVSKGGDRPDNGNHTRAGLFDIGGRGVDVHIRIKCRHGVDHGGQYVHRMRSLRKVIEEAAHIFMDEAVQVEHTGKIQPFLRCRQSAVYQKIGDIDKGGFFYQFFNGNTAVTQNAAFTVDISYLTPAAGGIDP